LEQFTEAFKQRIHEKDLGKIEHLFVRLSDRSDKRTDVREPSPVSKLPFKIYDLSQIGLRRSLFRLLKKSPRFGIGMSAPFFVL
jgi:hypothetical protein